MNPQSQLQQAELTRRQSELDAREAYIDSKLELLENAPITLKVYDARVAAKEQQLADLEHEINDRQLKRNKLDQDISLNSNKLKDSLILKQTELDRLNEQLAHKSELLKSTETKIKSINKEIDERQLYLKEQEAQIELTIEQGNERILDLKDEVGKLEDEITDLRQSKVALKQDVDDLALMKQDLELEHTSIVENQSIKEKELADNIKLLQDKVIDESRKLTKIQDDIDAKLAQLKEKETSLLAKSDAIILERQELERDKRQFQATRSLYEQ